MDTSNSCIEPYFKRSIRIRHSSPATALTLADDSFLCSAGSRSPGCTSLVSALLWDVLLDSPSLSSRLNLAASEPRSR